MSDTDVYVRLRGRYAELLADPSKVLDLDDEELARGQLKAVDGSFRGRPPLVVPTELVQAMRREWLGRAEAKLREALMDAGIKPLVEIAQDKTVDAGVRVRAAEKIIERNMGKVPDKVELKSADPVEDLFRRILGDPEGLIPHEPSAAERALLT
jgi:hypothetical protein